MATELQCPTCGKPLQTGETSPAGRLPRADGLAGGRRRTPRPYAPVLPFSVELAAARQRVLWPAIGLMITGALGLQLSLILTIAAAVAFAGGWMPEWPYAGAARWAAAGFLLVMFILSGAVLYGATRLKNLKNRGWAMTAAIAALVPCIHSSFLVGLPFGIWAVIAISRRGVRAGFRHAALVARAARQQRP